MNVKLEYIGKGVVGTHKKFSSVAFTLFFLSFVYDDVMLIMQGQVFTAQRKDCCCSFIYSKDYD